MKNQIFEMSDSEKKTILAKHKQATKSHYLKKEELNKGLQKPKKTS
jgi:hypothetical protein